jgi:lipoate-protein ligase A
VIAVARGPHVFRETASSLECDGRKWAFRHLDTGLSDAARNMALDEAILIQVGAGVSPPTIRFYGWTRPTLSLGYFQSVQRDVDEDELQGRGYALVRRMTGGRAVLHDRELTYSIIVPADHDLAKASVTESYRLISRGLREGFRALGLMAEMVSLEDEDEREKFISPGSAACFDSPSRYELVVEGRKIAGSAQVRAHGGMLQHGSLPLELRTDDLFAVLRFRTPEEKAAMRESFVRRAVGIAELADGPVSYQEASQAFARGMAAGLPAMLTSGQPSEREWELAEELIVARYAARDWTHRR